MRDMVGNEAINLPEEGEIEVWVQLEEWPNYEISTFGRIRNYKGKILKPRADKNGYYTVCLYKTIDGKSFRKYKKIGRLVCETFWGAPEGDRNVSDHIDRCRVNNYYKNLRWVNRSESTKNRSQHIERNFSYGDKKTPILLVDRNTNEIIARFSSPAEARKAYGVSRCDLCAQLNGGRRAFSFGRFVREQDYYANIS